VEELAVERRVRWFKQVRQTSACPSRQRTDAEFPEVEFGFWLLVTSAVLEGSVHGGSCSCSN